MGLSLAFTGDEPEFVAAMSKASKISKERGIPMLGGALGVDMIKTRVAEGYRAVVCCFDLHVLAYGMISALGEARAGAEMQMQESTAAN